MSDAGVLTRQATERLARGEQILVLDDLARAAEHLRAHLGAQTAALREKGQPRREHSEDFLAEPTGEFFALAIPLVTYGDRAAMRALSASFTHMGRGAVAAESGLVAHNEAGTAIVGRMLWALTAQGLAADNLGVLTVSRSAAFPVNLGHRHAVPMCADRRLRYAAACGGNSVATYDYYRDWLVGQELLAEACPYLAADPELHLSEADFLLALTAAEDGYGGMITRGLLDREMLARFVTHLRSGPAEVARFLAVDEAGLELEVVRRADLLKTMDNPWRERSPLGELLGLPNE